MHTVELLEEAVAIAKQCGFNVRQDCFDGAAGTCEFRGRQWIFLDLAMSPHEQLEQILQALRNTAQPAELASPQLQRLLKPRKAA